MRNLILTLMILATTTHASIFDNGEKDRRIQTEQPLQHERQANDGLGIVIIILGVGCVVLLAVGTAIGSKVRRERSGR